MKILFVHQNFPAQYKHLAPALAARGHEVFALGMSNAMQATGVTALNYSLTRANGVGTHPLAVELESKVIRGEAAANKAFEMRRAGFNPDVICAHPGWGEPLFLKDIWPRTKLLSFLEYYYRFEESDVDFDAEFADSGWTAAAKVRMKNANNLLALEAMDGGVSPTNWQRSLFPVWARERIATIHDGINTAALIPNRAAVLISEQAGLRIQAGEEIVTFVSRSLEPYRGFHVFMRALPAILKKRPHARVVIVGSDEPGYGAAPPDGKSWRQVMLQEVGEQLDLGRVHFVGKVSHQVFVAILQVSAVHVYLTYPFVLSWSMLEAMSIGCVVVGSKTAPVEEVIQDGQNGRLVDFFDVEALANTVAEVLASPKSYAPLGLAARQTVVDKYDLHSLCLPKHVALVERLSAV